MQISLKKIILVAIITKTRFFKTKKPHKWGFFVLAGCRLQVSNRKPKNMVNKKELSITGTKVEKSARFANDLMEIHEFYNVFRKEIHKVIDFQ